MILLDTNVISEMMKPVRAPTVHAWLNDQVAETLFLSSVTLAQLLFGIAALPDGRRKQALASALEQVEVLFGARILPFDLPAARFYAAAAAQARTAGRGFPTPDGYIAAIAGAAKMAVATRDTAPFEAAGLKVVNPWCYGVR